MLNGDSVNKVILMGRIGNEPFWKTVNGTNMLCFSLITTEKIKRHGDLQDHDEWHQVQISDKLVNPAFVVSGKVVYVQGRLRTVQSLDQQGVKHYKAEVVACSVEPVDLKLHIV